MLMTMRGRVLPKSLAPLDIKRVNHRRWLTTANKVLRLYVYIHNMQGKEDYNLRLLTELCFFVYSMANVNTNKVKVPEMFFF